MNIELAKGEQAFIRLRRIERPTTNVEWKRLKKEIIKSTNIICIGYLRANESI